MTILRYGYGCECDESVGLCPGTIPAEEWNTFRNSISGVGRGLNGDLFIARKDCPNHPSPQYTILKEEGNLVLVRKND